MSEKLHSHAESAGEKLDIHAESQRNLERSIENGLEARNEATEQLDQIKASIEQQAISGKEITVGERESSDGNSQTFGIHQALKKSSYKRSLKKVQSQLNPVERTLSKTIHNPVIDRTSEGLARTVARPQGILFGGIFAVLGSSVFLYFTKHYGFEYNYLAFIALFIGGYIFGLFVDLFRAVFKRS